MNILTEEQRACAHVFMNVTDERRRLIEEGELPEWAKILIDKEDRRWVNRSEKWRSSLKYLKCGMCDLLRIVDQDG